MKKMSTLTMPNGVKYEIVDKEARSAINSERDDIRKTCATAIAKTVTGNVISASDCSANRLIGLKLFGNTTQATTTGKNLFDIEAWLTENDIAWSKSGNVYTITTDMPLHNNPFVFSDEDVEVTLSATVVNNTTVNARLELLNSNGETAGYFNEANSVVTCHACKVRINWTTTGDATFTCPQIEYGNEATAYEPYTGGIASPNLDYPQDIASVEDVTIGLCGANILDQSLAFNATGDTEEITKTITDDSIILSGTPSRNYVQITTGYLELPNYWRGHTVKFGASTAGNEPHIALYFRDANRSIVAQISVSNSGEKSVYIPTDATHYEFAFCLNRVTTGTAFTATYSNVYLSVSDDAEGYEEYITPKTVTVIDSIPGNGTISDEIDFERGVYIKRFGTDTVTGVQFNSEDSSGRFVANNTFTNYYKPGSAKCFCNIAKWSSFAMTDMSCCVGAHTLYYRDNSKTLDEINALFADLTVTVVGALVTPVEIPLSEELIAEYKTLYANYPNITIMNSHGVQMEATYNVDTQLYYDNLPKPSDEQVQNSINEYFAANPPGVTKLTFTGAVNATYDGSAEVTVNIPTVDNQVEEALANHFADYVPQDGEDGHTPEKGVDYWTEADKTEIINATAAKLKQEGISGDDGKSAYEFAVDGGYKGSEEDFAVKMAESHMKFVSLWENANPGTAFSAQTVTIEVGLEGYDMVAIVHNYGTNTDMQINTWAFGKIGTKFAMVSGVGNGNSCRTRMAEALSTGVKFYDGYTTDKTMTTACVPVKIYGIKGVF